MFIRTNRGGIDLLIRDANHSVPRLTDLDREQWIYNYEPLYRWALAAGVRV
jgi:hypothetical protein